MQTEISNTFVAGFFSQFGQLICWSSRTHRSLLCLSCKVSLFICRIRRIRRSTGTSASITPANTVSATADGEACGGEASNIEPPVSEAKPLVSSAINQNFQRSYSTSVLSSLGVRRESFKYSALYKVLTLVLLALMLGKVAQCSWDKKRETSDFIGRPEGLLKT